MNDLAHAPLETGGPKFHTLGDILMGEAPHRSPDETPATSPFPSPSAIPVDDSAPLDENAIIVAMRWVLDQESRARLKHEASWARSWELYNNRYSSFIGKAKWQSKKALPRVWSQVHRIESSVAQLLTNTSNWFTIPAGPEEDQQHLDMMKWDIQETLDDPSVNFDLVFSRSVVVGCLSQLVPFMITTDDRTPTPTLRDTGTSILDNQMPSGFADALIPSPFPKRKLPPLPNRATMPRIELIDPFRVYKDSTNRERYIIRTYRYTRGEFRQEAERCGWRNVQAVLDGSSARGSSMESPLVDEIQVRNQDNMTMMFMDERDYVHIEVLWGSLYDESGDILFENSWAVLANQQYLVFGPEPFSDAHGMPPIIAPALIDVPFSPYGKSMIGVSADATELTVEFLNLLVDYFQKLVMGMVEIDEHLLEGDSNPRILFPGKVFVRSPEADPTQSTVRPIQFAEPSVQLWQFLGSIQQEIDSSQIGSGSSGQQRVRGRVSAQEYTRRQADAGSIINTVFKKLEKTLLTPILYRIYMNRLQYTPQEEWDALCERRAKMVQGEAADTVRQMIGWDSDTRIMKLGQRVRFRVRIFSAISDRQAELEKATIIMNMLKSDPITMQHLNRPRFLRRIFEALGWDPEEYVIDGPPQPPDPLNPLAVMQWQQQLEQMLEQLKGFSQQQQQPGNPVGPGQAGAGMPSLPGSTPSSSTPQPSMGVGPGGPPNPLAAILGATSAGAGGGSGMTSNAAPPVTGGV